MIDFSKVNIILGSGSPRRKHLFEVMEIPHKVLVKSIDEQYDPTLKQSEITDFLAQSKGVVFQKSLGAEDIVVTADTIVWFHQRALGKPTDELHAIEMLKTLSGQTHQVFTSVCFTTAKHQHTFHEKTDVTFTKLSEKFIKHYVQQEQPLDKAGAYGIQDWFGALAVSEICGSYTNVIGLPCAQTYLELEKRIKMYF
jgi:septum formation protein